MRQISVILDGKKKEVDKGSDILSMLPPTAGDPPVAARINGIARSLRETVTGNSTVDTILLSEKDGRRVYRKTLCFLLSYASSVVAPERVLIIGHSLGDGYYFRYRGGEKPDIASLEKVMRKAVEDDLPVEIVTLTYDEAISYATRKGLTETETLIRTRNDPTYRFAVIDKCMEVYYEPLLPSVGLLNLWEIREYRDGILLRYPQSRSPEKILPFSDNDLLFSIFKKNKTDAEILGVSCLGDLNKKVETGEIEETIRLSEYIARRKISDTAETIKSRGTVKAVFISGPSSSGKTTASLKICDELKIRGYSPIKVSLDNYYKTLADTPIGSDGEPDFECLEALDIDLFRKQLSEMLSGGEVILPTHDFKTKTTSFKGEPVSLSGNRILVIEGLHGNNPNLCPNFPKDKIFRIYISALTQVNLDSRSRISTTDNRILRRLIRDKRTRGVSAPDTLSMWPSVERGEKANIFPYQNNADVMINSALEYELGVLSPHALPLLRSIDKNSGNAYSIARRLIEFLILVHPIPDSLVPGDSIIREFIGGSVYGVV